MNQTLKSIMESIDDSQFDFEEALEEENTTSNLDGGLGQPKTPFAFIDKREVGKQMDKIMGTNKFFKQWETIDKKVSRIVSEATYNDFKNDDSRTSRQKINTQIMEISGKLREVEQMINHAAKLKTESGADQSVFWKGTLRNFQKIDERLLKLSAKIREINT